MFLLCWMTFYNTPFMFFRSLLDDTLPAVQPEEGPITYEIIESWSQKGKDLLVDNRGYSFNVKWKTKSTVFWVCFVWNQRCALPPSANEVATSFPVTMHTPTQPSQVSPCRPASHRRLVWLTLTWLINLDIIIIIINNNYKMTINITSTSISYWNKSLIPSQNIYVNWRTWSKIKHFTLN